MTDQPIAGGCLCGAIRYSSTEVPATVATCHCRTCQKGYGGPFTASVAFRKSAFTITKGALKFFASSKVAQRGFCSTCGSPILIDFEFSVPFAGEHYFVRIGSLDNPENYKPKWHYGVESQLPWVHLNDGLPTQSTADKLETVEALATGQGLSTS